MQKIPCEKHCRFDSDSDPYKQTRLHSNTITVRSNANTTCVCYVSEGATETPYIFAWDGYNIVKVTGV